MTYPLLLLWATLAGLHGSWALILAHRALARERWFRAGILTTWGLIGYAASGALCAIALGA